VNLSSSFHLLPVNSKGGKDGQNESDPCESACMRERLEMSAALWIEEGRQGIWGRDYGRFASLEM